MSSSREGLVYQFFNVIRQEYKIASRRIGLWIAAAVVTLFYAAVEIVPYFQDSPKPDPITNLWPAAALTVFKMNLFFPLVGGILAADRLTRDHRLGVYELQESTPIHRGVNLLGKYLGVAAAWFVPEVICLVIVALIPILGGSAGWEYLGAILVCGMAINLPSLLFVTAFSLVCPMVMPVRVYQVLFTGYWFWGNFLSPEVFPTVSGTLLNAAGTFALQGFFGGTVGPGITFTALQAVLNIALLFLLAAAILLVVNLYLAMKMKKA